MRERHEKVMKTRQKVYGPTGPNFKAFGKAVTAVLEAHFQMELPHDIPASVASLIYAQGKLIRMALPFDYNSDSAVDLKAYAQIADEIDTRKPNGKVPARNKRSSSQSHGQSRGNNLRGVAAKPKRRSRTGSR